MFFPKLRYYTPKTDLIGILDEKVRYIYTFKGMESNYPSDKVRLLEVPVGGARNDGKKVAVVVGQPLLKDGFATEESVELITKEIHSWIKENHFESVFYSKHPRSSDYLDFYCDDYVILEQNGAIEPLLCEIQPYAIISCYSTALAIGKSLLGNNVRCVSIGLDHTNTDKKRELRAHFRKADIEYW